MTTKNRLVEYLDFYEIVLSKGKTCKIDKEDLVLVGGIKWHSSYDGTNYYACCSKTKSHKPMKMHRLVLNIKDSNLTVDHINGDTLDNRKSNLRACKHSENMKNQRVRASNTSGYRGVYYNKSHKKWRAQIQDATGKRIYLGSFDLPEEAAKAFSEAANKNYKDFKGDLYE